MTGIRNQYLSAWIDATGLSHGEIARRVTAEAIRQGYRQVRPDTSRLRRWMEGESPRPPVPQLLAQVLSDAVGEPLDTVDLGFAPLLALVDTVKLPLLSTCQPSASCAAASAPDDGEERTLEASALAAAHEAVALAEAVIGYHHAVTDMNDEPRTDAERLLRSALSKAHLLAERLGGIGAEYTGTLPPTTSDLGVLPMGAPASRSQRAETRPRSSA